MLVLPAPHTSNPTTAKNTQPKETMNATAFFNQKRQMGKIYLNVTVYKYLPPKKNNIYMYLSINVCPGNPHSVWDPTTALQHIPLFVNMKAFAWVGHTSFISRHGQAFCHKWRCPPLSHIKCLPNISQARNNREKKNHCHMLALALFSKHSGTFDG